MPTGTPETDPFRETKPTRDNQIDAILKKWPDIEVFSIEAARRTKLQEELIEYVHHLRNDNSQVQILRNLVVCLTVLLLGYLWISLVGLIALEGTWIFANGNAGTAFVVGLFAFTGLFVTVVLRGAFKLARDRHEDSLPPNIQEILKQLVAETKSE